jgi:antitoxin (DNA-binding transcriptional repressor) of toxin-antitoxin stability system
MHGRKSIPAKAIQVGEFRENLAFYLKQAEAGAAFVVLSRNKPVARLVPPARPARRRLGLLRGKIQIAKDFDQTPDALIAAMEDGGAAAHCGTGQ